MRRGGNLCKCFCNRGLDSILPILTLGLFGFVFGKVEGARIVVSPLWVGGYNCYGVIEFGFVLHILVDL